MYGLLKIYKVYQLEVTFEKKKKKKKKIFKL